MNKVFTTALLVLVLAAGGCSRSPASNDGPLQNLGPAPAWTLKNLDGKPVSLSDFKGKVVVLDFWATWCPPCRAEIPHFIEIQNEYKDKGVTIIGASVDSTGPADVAKFAKDNGMNYPIVMADDKVTADYGADQGIPTTFVIDKKGNVVGRHLGITEKDVFVSEIEKALKE